MIRVNIKEGDTGLGFRFTINELRRMQLACIGAAGYMRMRFSSGEEAHEAPAILSRDKYAGPLMTVREAALYTGLSENTLYNAVRLKWITAHKLDGEKRRNYFRRDELDVLMMSRKGGNRK
ncbi:MAG: helix-turn-helix domain-containing protein [Duncaniella sp.]|nr:helix-turn-helix domain-containing protein [Duncaniella sp.]MDE7146362.1 helix-turn-helix domain-containing protein [Duncaniella sp.]